MKKLLFFFLAVLLNLSCSKDEKENLDVTGFYVADASFDMLNASTFTIEKINNEYIFTAHLSAGDNSTAIVSARFYNIPNDDVIDIFTGDKYGHISFSKDELRYTDLYTNKTYVAPKVHPKKAT